MRKNHSISINYRIISLFLAVLMILTSVKVVSFLMPTVAAVDSNVKIRDDALHFIIRHWHMAEDSDAQIQGGEGGQWDPDAKEYFVIAEGYIMPKDNGNGYVCYAVSQNDNNTLLPIEDVEHSLYVDSFDPSTGVLYLNKKLITDDITGKILEDYTGLSVSAGHSAIKEEGNNIVIEYNPYVHLVKAHVFYNPTAKKIRGVKKEEWPYFENTDLYGDTNNEVDTIWVYTYIDDDDNGNKAGDIYLNNEKVVERGDLPENIDTSNLQLTKFYSSAEGLHTDNTVIAVGEDGRTFTVDLEAWYNEGYAPNIGFALDASGSMAFALDTPTQITVDEDFIEKNDINLVENNLGNDWEDYFLTDEQLKKILNPHNTDNSLLSASGYSYFVQNGSAYEPLGYWEGTGLSALLPFNKGDYGSNTLERDWLLNTVTGIRGTKVGRVNLSDTFEFEEQEITSWGDGSLTFTSANGFRKNASTSGIMLDVAPKSGNFTVSFKMTTTTTGDKTGNDRKMAQLLYIGPESGAGSAENVNGNYYTLYRDQQSSANRLRGNQRINRTGNVTDVNNIFNNSKTYTVTLVFENADTDGGTVTTYIDGDVGDMGSGNGTPNASNGNGTPNVKEPLYEPFSLKDLCIVLNGVEDDYDGADIFIDEFALYDFALSSSKVKELASGTSGTPKVATTLDGDTLGSINIISGNTVTQNVTLNHTQAGWYHITHAGEYKNHYLDIGTGKRLFGVAGSQGQSATDENGNNYTPTEDLPTRFYVDGNGNLCCFFGAKTNSDGLSFSYVYELADGKYIRTEGLQRILGSFTNKLNEKSPSAKVSAVRYSANTSDLPLNELVLLDWTNDPKEMANMLSLNRGDGTNSTKTGYTTSANGIKQYNYGLTGGTDTYKGLQSYLDNLSDGVDKDNPYKYFIIFTDGANTDDEAEAIAAANELKKLGYTIYAVALIADKTSNDYDVASQFLPKLIGKTNDNDANEYLFFADDMTTLTDRFQTILDDIAIDLGEYTVTNYIDPRFDLVGYDDSVWHLYANGKVEVVNKDDGSVKATYDLSSGNGVEFTLSGETTTSACKPKLKFNSANDKDMYYLEWTKQTIPPSPENADVMEAWNAEYQIRAKDDFIGGNAILTNGNKEEMNWVRCPDDKDASSGTDDRKKDEDNGDVYPSKGFPRTTVNVKLLPIKTNPLDGIIYKGEAVSPRQILTEIKDNYMTETYYLEYLKRYAYQRYDRSDGNSSLKNQMDRPLLDLLTEWLEIGNDKEKIKAFSVPYMYLPSVEWDEESGKISLDGNGKATTIYNNTGDPKTNELDVVGVLTFRWEQLDPTPKNNYEPIRDYVKTDTERATYSLTVEYTPLRVGDSYELFYGTDEDNEAEGEAILTTAEGYPIVTVAGTDGADNSIITYAETGKVPFEAYLQIDSVHKGTVDEFTRLDREKYINGNTEEDHRGSYALISDKDYKWNKIHKSAEGKEELIDTNKDDPNYPYGDALLINNYGTDEKPDFRSIKAISTYTADVVSGGIALEFKMLIGELEEAAKVNGGNFEKEFTLNAKRAFKDTEIVESLKEEKYNGKDGNPVWEDYGENFEITFNFDYSQSKIAALKDEVLANPDKYPDGYVTISAIATSITAKNATFEDKTKAEDFTEFPIGTYDFSLDEINKVVLKELNNKLLFATAEDDQNDEHFDEAYFDELVLNGLHTKNEKSGADQKWREKRDENGKIIYDKDGKVKGYYDDAEINNDNITKFKAKAYTSDKKTVSLYIGTVAKDLKPANPDTYEYVPVRGKVVENPYDPNRYSNERLGILLLSTGTTRVTVKEDGALENESFLYRITGKTLGYDDVDLIISVTGDGSTTVEIMPGEYTITEISDPTISNWSWKYKNKDTKGNDNEDWTIVDLKTAKTSPRYREDDKDPILKHMHKTVTYFHERNDKVWLGGENHKDNKFSGVVTSDEE